MTKDIVARIEAARNLGEAFFEYASAYPDEIVYSQSLFRPDSEPRDYVSATYSTVVQKVTALALFMKDLGVSRGMRVAIISNSRPEWMVADLASLSIGAVTVGIYQSLPADDIGYILYDSGAEFVFVEN